jgi:FMN-dependent oxidoreductase (nitrilotriacetate monooxygenase family)
MHHNGSWRHPDSDVEGILDIERYERLAQIYERGLFDAVFIVDYQVILDWKENIPSQIVHFGGQMAMLDPLQVLVAMARATKHLGLAATLSTSYNHAYQIARKFATLDHISNGRAGWNIVTSAQPVEAKCMGLERLPDKDQRYDQADQVIEACTQLWESWDEDALIRDRERGRFADPKKVHHVSYNGSLVRTSGALTTPRSPQVRPVFMQAGASDRGRDFAARWAEIIFCQQPDKASLKEFYKDVKHRMAAHGRAPDTCAILPSIAVISGASEAEAQARAADVDRFAIPELGLKAIEVITGRDLSGVPLDTPLDDLESMPGSVVVTGVYENWKERIKQGSVRTLREAAMIQSTTWSVPRFVGTVKQVVDQMQDLFDSQCCDGFIIAQPLSPGGLIQFVDEVVPELQRRGLYRKKYEGKTFRENLRIALGGSHPI